MPTERRAAAAACLSWAFALGCTPPAPSGDRGTGDAVPADTAAPDGPGYTDATGGASAGDTAQPADESRYGPLRINEFMAVNATAWSPDGAAFPDWIELFNSGDAAIDLGGVSLSDELDAPLKSPLPEGLSLEPGAFLVLEASGADVPSGTALTFKLSGGGEELGVFTPSGVPVHLLRYGPQEEDFSAALAVDGDRDAGWVYVRGGSPGLPNAGD